MQADVRPNELSTIKDSISEDIDLLAYKNNKLNYTR